MGKSVNQDPFYLLAKLGMQIGLAMITQPEVDRKKKETEGARDEKDRQQSDRS